MRNAVMLVFTVLIGILALSSIVVAIVKIANYVNGKGFTTERKLARKLLGAELAVVLLWVGVIWYTFTYVD